MYIDHPKKTYKGKTYRSCLLRESYRDANGKSCKRTILNLDSLPKEIADIIITCVKSKKKFNIDDFSGFVHEQGKSYGALKAVFEVAKRAGIVKALGNSPEANLSLLLISGILTSPIKSKNYIANSWSKNQAIKEVLGLDEINENDLYKALDFLAENQRAIETRLACQRIKKTNKEMSVFLYDLTSSYVEGNKIAFCEFGYNRDKKKGKKQISIGLLTDVEGYPLSIEVFKGNIRDYNTVSSQLEKIKNRFKADNIVIVGDRGMIKSKQIEEITSNNWNYITGITRPQVEKLLNDKVIQLEFFDTTLQEIVHNGVRYILRLNPIRAKEISNTLDEKLNKITTFVEKKNKYLSEHKRARPEVQIKNIRKLADKLKISKYIKISSENRIIYVGRNDESISEYLKLAGCYVLRTDLEEKACSKETVHQRYKDLIKVELDFRDCKTGLLDIRPIFVRTKNHVKGHVFAYMLSLIVSKFVEESLKMTGFSKAYIWETLDKIQYQKIKYNKKSFKSLPSILNKAQKIILKKLKISFPKIL